MKQVETTDVGQGAIGHQIGQVLQRWVISPLSSNMHDPIHYKATGKESSLSKKKKLISIRTAEVIKTPKKHPMFFPRYFCLSEKFPRTYRLVNT